MSSGIAEGLLGDVAENRCLTLSEHLSPDQGLLIAVGVGGMF